MKSFEAKSRKGRIFIEPSPEGLKAIKERKLMEDQGKTLRELVEAVEMISQELGLDISLSYRTNTKKEVK